MAKATAVLTGDKQLNRVLRRLSGKDAKAAIRKGSRKALKPVLADARQLAPVRTGALRRSIKVRAIKRSRTRVGSRVTTGKATFTGPTFYGGFVEYGYTSRGGRTIAGVHFLEQAATRKQGQAVRIYRDEIRRAILQIVKRTRK